MCKIREPSEIQWRHVATRENPTDLASRGGPVSGSQILWDGPKWLAGITRWPGNAVAQKSQGSAAEAKVVKEVLAQQHENLNDNIFEDVLKRHELRRSLCIQAWMPRLTKNRHGKAPAVR